MILKITTSLLVLAALFLNLSPAQAYIISSTSAAGGFTQGDKFTATPISGTVTVQCNNTEPVTYSCYETTLDPVGYDFFQGPANVAADEIAMTSVRPDGSRRDRVMGYNGASGRSDEVFNLWISTLFQRPLLQVGVNKLEYALMRNSQVVQKGQFNVTVVRGAARACPLTHYTSTDSNDCTSQYSVCQRYFEQYSYCRMARPSFK